MAANYFDINNFNCFISQLLLNNNVNDVIALNYHNIININYMSFNYHYILINYIMFLKYK